MNGETHRYWTGGSDRGNLRGELLTTEVPVSSVDDVVKRALAVLAQRPSALVTDVDGTLSRIVARPEEAYVSQSARNALQRLLPKVDLLAVVTGRENEVARRMVGIDDVKYVGSYALSDTVLPEGTLESIAQARSAVEPYLERFPGVRLETKDVSFALHYRGSADADETRMRLIALLEPIAAEADAKLLEGKLVVEVAPRSLPDKGTAFAALMHDASIHGAIFVGDDLADTTIFREIRRRRAHGMPGLAIGVVDDETPDAVIDTTDVQLDGVGSVETFLSRLADEMAGS